MLSISLITILKCNNFIYIKNLYENILEQTFKEYILEWIILDGTNKSKYMLQNKTNITIFLNNLNNNFKIKYVDLHKTDNYTRLRNIGNNISLGEYIIYMDIYEYNFKNRIEYGINKLKESEYEIAGNKENLFYKDNKIYKINNETLYLNSLIYKKEFIKNHYYNENIYYFLNKNNILNMEKKLTINVNINDEGILDDNYDLPERYKNITKNDNNNENEIVYYIGKDLIFNPVIYNVNYTILKEYENLKTNITNAIELIINFSKQLKLININEENENNITVYGNFKEELIYNNVNYANWYNYNNYKNKNIIIIWDIVGITSFIHYNINCNIIIINFVTLNFKLLNNLDQFLLFNLLDNTTKFIFKCEKQCELFKYYVNNKYENEKYIIIPNIYIYKEEIEYELTNLNSIKNENRFCYLGNNMEEILLLDHIWTYFIKQNIKNELHIHVDDLNKINLLNNNNNIYIHKLSSKTDYINEIKKSKYIFINIYDTLDMYNHYIFTNLKCIPIILKEKYGLKTEVTHCESYDYTNILYPLKVITNFKIYFNEIYKFKKFNNIKWALPSNNKLSLVIIEPRIHYLLPNVLYNMAHYYKNTNTSLYIYHSDINKDYVNNIIETWENVQLKSLCYSNISIDNYNKILQSINFWGDFKSENVLIFQTDTMIFKKIPEEFYLYDFIGAPNLINKKYIGLNGGLSLRNTKMMQYICLNYNKLDDINEDIYYFNILKINNNNLPSIEISSQFALEALLLNKTNIICGTHAFWFHFNKNIINNIFKINMNI